MHFKKKNKKNYIYIYFLNFLFLIYSNINKKIIQNNTENTMKMHCIELYLWLLTKK